MPNVKQAAAGLLAAIMACTGGAILLVQAAASAGMQREALLSWIFIVYVVGGALNLFLSLRYNMPFAGAHSITAAAFLSTVVTRFSPGELAGSYIMAGALIAVLGGTGLFSRLLERVPRPLIDAMLAGIVLPYIVRILSALGELPLAGGMAVLGYLLVPRLFRRLPPILGALGMGTTGLLIGSDSPVIPVPGLPALPQWVTPAFTWPGLISAALPAAFLVISNDLAVALAALRRNGYEPPVNRAVLYSGLGTMLVGLFGGHAVNIGGMMTSLCSSEEAGDHASRYKAAVVCACLVCLFGLFAWCAVGVLEFLPGPFLTLIIGFSLIGVLQSSLQSAFSESPYRVSALLTFVIALSPVSWLGVASPVWALSAGAAASWLLGERPSPASHG